MDDPPLESLAERGYLFPFDKEWSNPWSSRSVSKQVKDIEKKFKNTCVECGSKINLEVDHIVPVSKNGTSDECNLQVLCRPCNRKNTTLSRIKGSLF
jgi:5-methylcytosine-specific restriction endonuclease McrA